MSERGRMSTRSRARSTRHFTDAIVDSHSDTSERRSRSPTISSPVRGRRTVDRNLPGNWTIKILIHKLRDMGIVLPNNMPHKTLFSLYEQLSTKNPAAKNSTSLHCSGNDDVTGMGAEIHGPWKPGNKQ